jgi:hypothetical protein
MTYRPPEKVLEGWERHTRAAELGPAGLQPLFEAVEARVHASPQLDVSLGDDSRIMVAGAQRKGWKGSTGEVACVANSCGFAVQKQAAPRGLERIATELRTGSIAASAPMGEPSTSRGVDSWWFTPVRCADYLLLRQSGPAGPQPCAPHARSGLTRSWR